MNPGNGNFQSSVFMSPNPSPVKVSTDPRAEHQFNARRLADGMAPRPIRGVPGIQPVSPQPPRISESMAKEILATIKLEYPFAESLLASKMTPEQFQLLMNKLPKIKQIIMNRMVPGRLTPPSTPLAPPQPAAPTGSVSPSKLEGKKAISPRFVELLHKIKKFAEIGLLDDQILDEPLSPVTLSMIFSMVMHVNKLTEMHCASVAGNAMNPEDEEVIRRRLRDMKEYIREEQKLYLEATKGKGGVVAAAFDESGFSAPPDFLDGYHQL